MSQTLTRRDVLQTGLLGTVGLLSPGLFVQGKAVAEQRRAANDMVGLALIGCGRRGDNYLACGLASRAKIVAACDAHLGRAKSFADKVQCRDFFQDYRRVLDRKDVDGVVIATPDHWHALLTIMACQAGKHVYVEKPLAMSIVEGRRMVQAARKYRRIVQVGSQQRSTIPNRDGCAFVRKGGIGKVTRVVTSSLASPWICDFVAQPIPAELDWNLWCGPSLVSAYHAKLYDCEGEPGWMECRDYSVGRIGNWGAHAIDQVQWALGADATGPVEIRVDGPPLDPPRYTEPEKRDRGWKVCSSPKLTFRYANNALLELGNGPLSGAIFTGEKGTAEIERGSVKVDPKELMEPMKVKDGPSYTLSHFENWFECMQSGSLPVADVEIGHRTATVCHLGNIGRRLGRTLQWDPVAERFVGDEAANQLLDRPRRKEFDLPSLD